MQIKYDTDSSVTPTIKSSATREALTREHCGRILPIDGSAAAHSRVACSLAATL